MNYFEFWIGDYKRDTARLGLIEHGAYQQLMLAYYAEEEALPPSYDELYQIAAAVTAADKAAVRKVADRFFPLAEDGLRHKNRIDEEIAKAQKRMEIARENGKKNKPKNPPAIPAGMPPAIPVDTRRDTQSGEALHTPHATSQDSLPQQAPIPHSPTEAGRACRLMRDAGCLQTNPSHPDLIDALAEGVTPEVLGDFARAAQGKGNPFAYAIGAARRAHAQRGPTPAARAGPQSLRKAGLQEILRGTHHDPNSDPAMVLDGDSRGPGDALPPEPRRLSGG